MEQPLYPANNLERTWLDRAKDPYRAFRKQIYYNLLLYPYALLKRRRLNQGLERSREHTYTAFYRSPGQIAALLGPVMNYILRTPDRHPNDPIQINVLAGSTGAEAYTLASVILKKYNNLDFHINCSDLHDYTVFKSQSAEYSIAEVEGIDVPEGFIRDTFDRRGDLFYVKPHIKEKVTFFKADIVADNLSSKYPPGDLVFMQNVLCHLDTSDGEAAFSNALSVAKHHSAIFIDGMPLDSKIKLTKDFLIEPLNYRIREIHENARQHLPPQWWNYYYGVEPYLFFKKDRARRYSTIFLRSKT